MSSNNFLQVELLGKCVSENTILCLSRLQSKLFSLLTTCRHFGNKVFPSDDNGSKQLIVIISNTESESLISCLTVHSSLSVFNAVKYKGQLSTEKLYSSQVIVIDSPFFRKCLDDCILKFDDICLLVFNECHLGLVDPDCKAIMDSHRSVRKSTGNAPLVIAVTTVLSTMYIEDSLKLEEFLQNLGQFYDGRIHVERTMLSIKYSNESKLEEQMIISKEMTSDARISLESDMDKVIQSLLNVLKSAYPCVEKQEFAAHPDAYGAAKVVFAALKAVESVLPELGPIGAAKLAENLVDQIEQHFICNMADVDGRKVLLLGITNLRSVVQILEAYYRKHIFMLEDLLPLVPSKVNTFLNEFKVS